MSENHRYTVADIDRMRLAIGRKIGEPSMVFYSSPPFSGMCGLTPESQAAMDRWHRETEDQLRTYMIGGVCPEELEELK